MAAQPGLALPAGLAYDGWVLCLPPRSRRATMDSFLRRSFSQLNAGAPGSMGTTLPAKKSLRSLVLAGILIGLWAATSAAGEPAVLKPNVLKEVAQLVGSLDAEEFASRE